MILSKITFWVVLVSGGISQQDLDITLNFAQGRYAEIGIDARFEKVILSEDICGSGSLSTRIKQYLCWRRLARNNRWKRPRRQVIVITPPLDENYTAGYSNMCSYRSRVGISVVNATDYNSAGESRLLHGAYSLLHEGCHSLGCEHVPDKTIMNIGELSYVDEFQGNLPWNTVAKRQVKKCLTH